MSFTEAHFRHFHEEGFVIVRGAVSFSEVERFLEYDVKPALRAHGINFDNPPDHRDGDTLRDSRHADGNPGNPITHGWPALYASKRLTAALDALHGGPCGKAWQWDTSDNDVGWIHLRYPRLAAWVPPEHGWHLDVGRDCTDTTKSVVVIPIVTPILNNGGGTCVAAGSHRLVQQLLHSASLPHGQPWDAELRISGINGIRDFALQNGCVRQSTGNAGDVLLMHPFLVHAASGACLGHPLRVAFNISTRRLEPFTGVLEPPPCFMPRPFEEAWRNAAHDVKWMLWNAAWWTSAVIMGSDALADEQAMRRHQAVIDWEMPPQLATELHWMASNAGWTVAKWVLGQAYGEDRMRWDHHAARVVAMLPSGLGDDVRWACWNAAWMASKSRVGQDTSSDNERWERHVARMDNFM